MAYPHPGLIELAADRVLPAVEDLEALVHAARHQRLAGLLYTRVRGWANGRRPAWLETLAEDDRREQDRHQIIWHTLARVVGRLQALGLEVATAKGVTAEARWYQRRGERPCLDLDLLLAPDATGRIEEAVSELQPDHPLLGRLKPLVEQGLLQSVEMWVGGIPVDLHLDILKMGIAGRQRDRIWERTVPFTIPTGGSVQVLDPELSLVHFLLHINKDQFRHLLGFADVARLLEHEELDWAFIDTFLRAEGLELPTYLSLRTVVETLGLALPVPKVAGGPRAVVWRIVWRPSVRFQGYLVELHSKRRQFWLPFLARGRFREAFRWWLRALFPPKTLFAYHHPGVGGPYLWRLVLGRLVEARQRRRAAGLLEVEPQRAIQSSSHGRRGSGRSVGR